jgi:ATP-binding cassette subfamily B protein
MAYSGQGVMKDLRLKLYNHTICQSLAFLDTNPVGRLVTRVTNDVETINELFTTVLINFLKDISLMLGVIITLFLLNFRLGLITILTLPPVFLITFYFRTKAREAFRRVRLWLSTVNTYLSEHISGMRIVQIFVQEERCKNEFQEKNDELMRANLGEVYVFAVFRPLIDLLSSTSIAVIIYFGARHFLEGIVSMGIVVAFINLIRKFYQPVRDISEKYTILQSAMAGSERVFELLDVEKRIPDNGSHSVSDTGSGRIEFDSVRFSYKEDEPVIRDLSFTVEPGETVAIVGYTGAGKTTIANLLTRLWDIQEGSIRLDGQDIREIKITDLRRAIQPVQQDVFLFNDSIAENIRLGKDISENKIIEASKLVQAHSFITEQEGGYHRQLNEGATNISTGQRQLLSFARVIAHNPKIVILDEATSNIDTETEKLIQAAMEEVMKNRTSLVIAHRLSTIKHADRILVLSRGNLVEQGKHEELLRKKGVYYTLYRLQYQE